MRDELIIHETDYQNIVKTGLKNGEYGFLNNLITSWLEQYPNDLVSEYYLSKIWLNEKKSTEAVKKITKIILRDPEFLEAYELLKTINGGIDKKAVASFIFVLGGTIDNISTIYPWAVTLRAVRMGIRRNELINSEKLINNLLLTEPNNPLVALAHCHLIFKQKKINIETLEKYINIWPDCIQFALFLARSKFQIRRETEAIDLLHGCRAMDPGGQVARRVFNDHEELLSFWDKQQSISLNIPIPSSIAIALKWNQLTEGENQSRLINSDNSINVLHSESNHGHNEEKNKDDKKPIKKSMKVPVYVVLSTKGGLEKKFGKRSAEIIIEKLKELSSVVKDKKNWDSLLFLPDEPSEMLNYGFTPISNIDPWRIKNSLSDLDKYLKTKNQMIGSVIIIGGHDIVPFHKLPNPTDDSDAYVLSDNPYGASSGNFLVPEWPVGRLPDEKGSDPGLLLEQIRQIKNFHLVKNNNIGVLSRILSTLLDWSKLNRILRDLISPPKNFGYTAAVWRRSTLAAFRPIGTGASLRVTPPYVSENIDIENLMKSKCAFFNLHGLSNTPEWYGQRDFSERTNGPDFPVAITTNHISKSRNNVDLTFSEACYGGFILNKSIEESIALKLIAIGSQGLVVSTCIAYGSVFPPLIGADLLAFIFWKYIKDGYSFGESLMQAKIGLIRMMEQRQGYLDGEDQKTLQSFVLYGDPLGYLEENIYINPHTPVRDEEEYELNIVSDQDGYVNNTHRTSEKLVKELNEIVGSYIPDLNSADVKIRKHQISLKKEFIDKGYQKTVQLKSKTHTQVTYSQKVKSARITHQQFARLTLDEAGKVIKLAVSR